MSSLEMRLEVNGRAVQARAPSHMRLLDFLREELHLTGTKEGCGAGECGTCSVFVDGVLVKSCLMTVARAQGKSIQTVEGLATAGKMSEVQRAFHRTGASQCGYCIPGMVMAATAALRSNPRADMEEIKERLGGNICRCTGYQKIFEAVALARDVINGTSPESALEMGEESDDVIGTSVRRVDAPGKVTGALKYAGDMTMPGMLHMQVLRSPHAHARVLGIDTSEAEAMPGVEVVITHRDVPGVDGFGVFTHDQPVIARDKVRYVGEPVAAVAATDLLTAKRALAGIKVRYEPLPGVFDPAAAMVAGAPVVHESAPGNLLFHVPIRKGDIEAGFAQADLVLEETFRTQAVEHAYLEPEAGLAHIDADGVLTIISPSQNITHHRKMMAKIMALPINKVRMIMSPVGGGFGGKEDMIYQGMLALATTKSRRPVRYVYTREESVSTTAKRHPFIVRCKMGLRRDGRIVASQIDGLADAGAYAFSSPGVMRKAAILGAGPYQIDHLRVDTRAIYTNNTPSGAFRTFGAMQTQFATESMLDIAAGQLGLDSFEIRRVNMMRKGANTHTKQTLDSVSLPEVLEKLEPAAHWEAGPPLGRGPTRGDLGLAGNRPSCSLGARFGADKRASENHSGKLRGRGLAAGWYGIARTAEIDRAGAWAELDDGGTAKVITGVTEIGEGILTVLAQIAAEELGIRADDITLGDNDTARAPEAAHAGATRQTYMIGNAVALACRDARARLVAEIADHWQVEADLIETRGRIVRVRDSNLGMSMAEAVQLCKARGVVPVGSGSFTAHHTPLDPVDGSGRPWQAYVFCGQVAEVEVDSATGEVQVLGIWAAHDIGRAINPRGVEAQIEGGVVMAVGQALMEDYKLDKGHTTTPGFAKYILPTSLDVPYVTSILIEDRDPLSPLGAKGIGEPAMVVTVPAILNAIHDAIGVRFTSLPVTPEAVLEGLRRKRAPARVAAE